MLIFALTLDTPAGAGPLISGLNSGTNQFAHGQACTIAGVQFTGTPGTITLRQGALSQVQSTGVSWADTSIAFTANTSIFAYGPLVLEVTNANGTDQVNVTLIPVAGKAWIAADVPWPSGDLSVFAGASPAVADNDQLEYDTTTNNAATVTMNADGTFSLNDATQGHTFQIRVFDQTDKTWSSAVTITVNYAPFITLDTIDDDGIVLLGQVGAQIPGTNFGATAGTVTIGGIAQTVQSWTDTLITIIVSNSTPLGARALVVTNATSSATVTITVQALAGVAPQFVGPTIAVPDLTQGAAITPINVAARFVDPTGQTLTYSTVGTWPPGVIVTAASGVIQGAPTVAGSYTGLAVRATDTDGNFVDSNTFGITVAAPVAQVPVFNGPAISLPRLTLNAPMTSLAVGSRFADPTGQALTFTARGTWPVGIIVTAATGTISGTPTVAGTSAGLTIRATDPDGNFIESNVFSIVVEADAVPEKPTDPGTGSTGGGTLTGALSDVLIANRALTKLGATRIISFADDTKEARAIASMYDLVRDAELRRRKWRFALKRTQLPALANSPDFGYAYAYQIPADCLSILSVGDVAPGVDLSDYRTGLDMGLYQLEGRTILTDLPAPLKLRYKARITDATQFDIAFVEALAARLAMELAEDLTQSAAKREQAGQDYKLALREAVAANAIEVAPEPVPDDSWLLSRN